MKTFKIQVRITEKMYAALQEACEEYGISISEFIRQLIMKYIVGEINLY
jgi:antitoxin component of RelBE/YafQ-DinJ toxin-antitoxin module